MFKVSLAEKLSKIFGIDHVSFSLPDPEAKEQECLFVEIETSKVPIKEKKACARVIGNALIVAPSSKIPFGYLSKRIAKADPKLTKDFFFYDLETNTRIFGDIIQMGFSFNYFYEEQYDPEIPKISGITVNIEEQ